MIKGKNIILRTIKPEDINEIFKLTSDLEEYGEYWPLGLPSILNLQKVFNESGLWGENNGRMLITDKENKIVGELSFFKGLFYQEGYEIGYRIYRREDRNKGYLTEALRIFCAYLFAIKPISRLQINLMKGNIASRRVAEKCGFQYDGILRKGTYHRGEYLDLELFSLLKEECPSLSEVL